jgi:glycosyltransferase involved in cell wall biosynthesis
MQITEDIHMIFDHMMMAIFYKVLAGKEHLRDEMRRDEMTTDKTVSVIMPLYNAAEYLPQALDSVAEQTLADWELIAVCEPNSRDGTNGVIAKYAQKDERVRLIVNSTHLGIAASLNVGIRAAQGEYIARMDGDDLCHPQRLEKQVAFLRENPDISILGSNIQFIDARGRPGVHISQYSTEHRRIKSDLLFYCEIMHPAVMMRKADMEKHHLYYDEHYTASEDFELWNRASRLVKLANLRDVLLYYRWGMNTSTRDSAETGDRNYMAVIDRSCRALGIAFTPEELRLLYPRTCALNLSNARYVKQTLENAARRITEANAAVGVYEPDALKETLEKRLYWKRRPVRALAAAAIRSVSVSGDAGFANAVAGYLEQRGFGMTIRRITQRMIM